MQLSKDEFFLSGNGSRKIVLPNGKIYTYIHNYKTGGMSFHEWCYDNLNVPHYHTSKHEMVDDTRNELGDLGQIFFTIRNPWDWCVSRWAHRKMRGHSVGDFTSWVSKTKHFYTEDMIDPATMHLAKWFEISYQMMRKTVKEMKKGAIVLRFENLESDFVQIQDALNCHVPLPHINSSPHTHYTDFYTDDTRRQVKKLFKDYIDTFGYKYGD